MLDAYVRLNKMSEVNRTCTQQEQTRFIDFQINLCLNKFIDKVHGHLRQAAVDSSPLIYFFFMLELFANGAILFILIKMSVFLLLSTAVQNVPTLGFISVDFKKDFY